MDEDTEKLKEMYHRVKDAKLAAVRADDGPVPAVRRSSVVAWTILFAILVVAYIAGITVAVTSGESGKIASVAIAVAVTVGVLMWRNRASARG